MPKKPDKIDFSTLHYDGAIILARRERFELTLDDVELDTGVSRDLVGRAERSTHIPNGEDLIKLMIYFKIEPMELLKPSS